jgi:hypothetical protein
LDDAAIKNLIREAEALEDYNEPFKHLAEIARIKQDLRNAQAARQAGAAHQRMKSTPESQGHAAGRT